LDGQSEKHSPRDFALWKKASAMHIMHWPSPWSEGFPGWHLECSAMSTKYLGETFDIHGGGMDLKFPHHECEIAQNQVHNHSRGARYWIHANMLTLNGRRMSKSTGNILNPQQLFSGENDILKKAFAPAVVRFFAMQAHYRSVLDFSSDALEAAEKGYFRLMDAMEKLSSLPANGKGSFDVTAWKKACYDAMNDDFNTPILIAEIFNAVSEVNKIYDGKSTISSDDLSVLKNTMEAFVYDVLGIQNVEKTQDTSVVDALVGVFIQERKEAREAKNWALSDQIRDRLAQIGVVLKDTKDGTTYSIEK
ncbi:MAG: cysteine--tRNA ligase, partial [Flavobacteriales bacterium]|nr:cysteine--tRNA ligase [Flavobacteriales bacterium]